MLIQDQCGSVRTLIALLIAFSFASELKAQDQAKQLTLSEASYEYSPARVQRILSLAESSSDFDRGLAVFTRATGACFSCHAVGKSGGNIGPELTLISQKRSAQHVIESILYPNREIDPAFQITKFAMEDGTVLSGYVLPDQSTESWIALQDPVTKSVTKVTAADIEAKTKGLSLMPEGLANAFSDEDLGDLVAFLVGLSKKKDLDLPAIEGAIRSANTHEAATFAYVAGPIDPDRRPAHKDFVNRDRVYDFYTKEAIHFSKQPQNSRPRVLQSYPGLDGTKFGHWGNQNEESWRGDESNQSLNGQVQCVVLNAKPKRIARAVCLRMSDVSACFNPDTLAYELLWTGGFLRYSSVRHGLMDGAQIDGKELELPPSARPIRQWKPEFEKATIQYRGYYQTGSQIVFCYTIDGQEYLDAPSWKNGSFERIVAPKSTHPMKDSLLKEDPQWPQLMETEIRLGQERGFAVDTIDLPRENPWQTYIYCGDHAFMEDGSAVVVSMLGDVWKVTGFSWEPGTPLDAKLKATWRRIASGLHQPLGIVIRDGQVFVLGRNQITRLNDLNGDGETDWYECYSNAYKTSPGGHDYICGLQTDRVGNFYTASGDEGILQVSKDGSQSKVIAKGFRNPDGIGILPDGTITAPASEGNWTPTSMIFRISPKSHTSAGEPVFETSSPPFCGYNGPKNGEAITLPFLYLPRGVDNSSGGQVWIDDARMGPLNHQLLHTSYGSGQAMMILQDKVKDQWQGAAVVLPGEYLSGIHRARVNPRDGQVYVTGMTGWGTYTSEQGCFQRLRYTGDPVQLPEAFHVHRNGLVIRFQNPVDESTVLNRDSHFVQCWNYRYSPGYGSKEFSVLHPPMVGHDHLSIASVHLIDDHSIFIELPELQLCNQLQVRLKVAKNDYQELFATIHAMDDDFTGLPQYRPNPNKKLISHPMKRDLEWITKSVPNPWKTRIEKARLVAIESRDNLQFSTKTLEAKSGEILKLTFSNPDVVPHNWALLRPGSLERIGAMTNNLVNDPDAYLRHYVPDSKDVLCYTDIVDPKDETAIYFQAPVEPGRYPYLCTFPGHWMVMNGELIVK